MSFRPIDLQVLLLQLQQAARGSEKQKEAAKNRESRHSEELIEKSKRSKEHVDGVEKILSMDQVRQKARPIAGQTNVDEESLYEKHPTIVDKKLGKRIDISK